jgi:7,8-dihydropterin-6-yl-methyl-4-(beta-D-ribofuranosyl)aminobenzene 5'-phosphate synthase
MGKNIRIITLIEDTSFSDGLLAEHGLSFFIEYGDKRILFDTGQSDMLVQNAETLDINLAEVDAIILSHGHYDHTGGLPAVLDIACKATVYLHPAAIEPKYNRKASGVKSIGMSAPTKKALQNYDVIWTKEPFQIFQGVTITGQIPRVNDFEDVESDFFLDKNCRRNDVLLDDQSLIIGSQKELVVIFGCAHDGVINTLRRIADLS